MNITHDQWKDKMVDEIWYMQIPEGMFEKTAKHTSLRLVDNIFDPTAEGEII